MKGAGICNTLVERGGGGPSQPPEGTVFSHYKPHMTRVLGYISISVRVIIAPALQRATIERWKIPSLT